MQRRIASIFKLATVTVHAHRGSRSWNFRALLERATHEDRRTQRERDRLGIEGIERDGAAGW
jgi:hypothetical protein